MMTVVAFLKSEKEEGERWERRKVSSLSTQTVISSTFHSTQFET